MLSVSQTIRSWIGSTKSHLKSFLAIAVLACIIATQAPSWAAEKIKFNFGLLSFKIELQDIDFFAETGRVPPRLNFYLQRISDDRRKQLQDFLNQTYEVKPWTAYRFSHTSVGEKMLNRMGDFIQIPQDINGFYGIRAAILKTVTSSNGNNLVNLLKNFPTDIKLNLPELLDLIKRINATERASQNLVSALAEQTNRPQKSVSNWQDISKLGSLAVKKETITFYDQQRDRTLLSDFYLPETSVSKIPLIIISNGLGAKRTRFDELANYLASYGFAVLIPEHPGSNYKRQQDFIKGLHKENFAATDYIERPRDISFLIDQLTATNDKDFNNQLDTNNVGIFGYSIGGTTALSLVGAKLDFAQLTNDCNQKLDLTNISILYQCRALETESHEHRPEKLIDKRVKAIYLFVPFGKSLFSPRSLNQINIPMLWQVVDSDFLTSLTKEQVPLYNSLQNRDHYFVLSKNLPHSTAILAKERSAKQQNQAAISKKYQNILSLIFFDQHVSPSPKYQNYLNQQFLTTIMSSEYKLHITQELPENNEEIDR